VTAGSQPMMLAYGKSPSQSSWDPSAFTSTSVAARAAGSVAGLFGTCKGSALNGGEWTPFYDHKAHEISTICTQIVPTQFGNVCCDAPATTLSIKQCSTTVSWATVARVLNADLPGFDTTTNLVGGTEDQCIQRCMQLPE
jgi:hypothetical protein